MKKVIVDIASTGQERLATALKNDLLPIVGVTVSPDVANYEDLCALTRNNVRRVRDLPVFAGAQRPLLDDRYVSDKFCQSAETSYVFPRENRANFMIETAKGPDDVEIVCLGALSNVALAVLKDGEAMKRVKKIYVAGGALLGYQTDTPTSQRNILADREAARTVFDSGIDIVLIPRHIADDLPARALSIAAGADYERWQAYLSVDVGIGFSRGQTIVDLVGRNPINGATATGKKQTVVTGIK